MLHLTGGFVGEGEAENILTRERWIRLEQRANARGDDARLAGSGARDDKQGAVAVFDRGTLFLVEAESFLRFGRGAHLVGSRGAILPELAGGEYKAKRKSIGAGSMTARGKGNSEAQEEIRFGRRSDGSSGGSGRVASGRLALSCQKNCAGLPGPGFSRRSAGMSLPEPFSRGRLPSSRAAKRPRVLQLLHREVAATHRSWIAQP